MAEKLKKLISIVAGARPNFMKIAPIVRELGNHTDKFAFQIIHTGQHYDEFMSDIFFRELGIAEPDFHLGAGGGTHAEQTASIMTRFENYAQVENPDLVLVVGDVNSTLACSIVAKKAGIPVAHVEAGLRSNDMAMPEEINRIVTDSITDFFFVTESSGVTNLRSEGKHSDAIFFVGHVMIDNLFFELKKLSESTKRTTGDVGISNNEYGVVTLHRPSNVDDVEVLTEIFGALNELSKELPLIFPVHPRTKSRIAEFGLVANDNLILKEPMGYLEFLALWKDARLVLTDSGGLQEETTALSVPCLTLRENTERPATVSHGSNTIVGTGRSEILATARSRLLTSAKDYTVPELWDGHAATRIVDILVDISARKMF